MNYKQYMCFMVIFLLVFMHAGSVWKLPRQLFLIWRTCRCMLLTTAQVNHSHPPTHHYYNMGYLILLEIKCISYNYNYRENYTVLLTLREIKYIYLSYYLTCTNIFNHHYSCYSNKFPSSVYVKDVLQLFHDQYDEALVLLVPVRLGSETLNSIYIPCIQGLLSLDCCVGIIGGRPKHSVYFIGFQGGSACLPSCVHFSYTISDISCWICGLCLKNPILKWNHSFCIAITWYMYEYNFCIQNHKGL